MVEITREGRFTLDSAIVHKAVFHCLPYSHPPPYKFLGVIHMSVYLSVCLMWWCEQTIVILQGYMCTYILFFIHLTFIFGPFTSFFVFCLLCFKYCLQKGFFPLLSFAFCVLTISFLRTSDSLNEGLPIKIARQKFQRKR